MTPQPFIRFLLPSIMLCALLLNPFNAQAADWDAESDKLYQALVNTFSDTSIPESELIYFNYNGGETRPPKENIIQLGGEGIERSLQEPVPYEVELAYRFGGGMILFDSHLYPDEFYVRKLSELGENPTLNQSFWETIITKQPILAWEPSKDQVIPLHATNSSLVILQSLAKIQGSAITLYRGTTLLEAELLRTLQEQQVDGKLPAAIKKQIAYWKSKKDKSYSGIISRFQKISQNIGAGHIEVSDIKEALADLWNNGQFGAVFVTTSLDKAQMFAKGAVVEFSAPASTLAKLAKARKLYVGFEKNIEMAFIADSQQELIPTFKNFTEYSPTGQIWNN